MSQEPWPCHGEDPWLSSKDRTMCVVLCSHGSSSIVWSENEPCCGIIAYFVGGKDRRIWFNIICLKLYQFKRTTWWSLSVLEHVLESVMEYAMQYVINLSCWKKYSKSHGLSKFVSDPPLGGRPDANSGRPCTLIHSMPCRTLCRLFIHKLFFGPLGLHLLVWSELGRSPPFNQWELLQGHGHGLSTLCVKWALGSIATKYPSLILIS